MTVVSELYLYPVKSCRGIRVDAWPVEQRGFAADRRWMIVDAAGRCVTQREAATLALVDTRLAGKELELSAPERPALRLPLALEAGEQRSVQIWEDVAVGLVHPDASKWISRYLGGSYELVYMPDSHERQVNPKRALPGDIVSFADAYPFLVISQASLDDLNGRLESPLEMQRFRPNIVVTGCEPYAEDSYAQVRIGEIQFRGPKRCERCVITTIDPATGEAGREPLRTLAKYRLWDQAVWFGMNLIHDGTGVLRVGDGVELTT